MRFCHRQAERRGQSLVEFAMIALVSYMLLAAIVTFGHLLFVAQGLQSAADTYARGLAHDENLRQTLFDEDYLVVAQDEIPPGASLFDFMSDPDPDQRKPIVNQLLAPYMVYNAAHNVFHYPGALVPDASRRSGYRVDVYVERNGQRSQVPIVEDDALPIDESSLVAVRVRINYPFHAAAMSGFQRVEGRTLGPPEEVPQDDRLPPDSPDAPATWRGPYSGQYGLGHQEAWGTQVRPFRRLITVQSIHLRDAAEPSPEP